jgi:hypothetical protein
MKLITETVQDIQYIKEAREEGGKSYFIEGPFLQTEIQNRNGRLYRKETMDKEVQRYIKEYVNTKRAFGELGHPDGPSINLDRVSHMIVSLKAEGNNYIGRAKIMTETPMGRIVKNLIDEGAQLGVSSRGMGSLKVNKEGVNEVQDDFYLATAADIVADPSAPDAFVRGIMEGKEWMMVEGRFVERQYDVAKAAIKAAKSNDLEAVKIQVFENFIRQISK